MATFPRPKHRAPTVTLDHDPKGPHNGEHAPTNNPTHRRAVPDTPPG